MEGKLCQEKENVFADQRAIACKRVSAVQSDSLFAVVYIAAIACQRIIETLCFDRHTSQTLPVHPSSQTFHPIDILLCLLENDRVTFL